MSGVRMLSAQFCRGTDHAPRRFACSDVVGFFGLTFRGVSHSNHRGDGYPLPSTAYGAGEIRRWGDSVHEKIGENGNAMQDMLRMEMWHKFGDGKSRIRVISEMPIFPSNYGLPLLAARNFSESTLAGYGTCRHSPARPAGRRFSTQSGFIFSHERHTFGDCGTHTA